MDRELTLEEQLDELELRMKRVHLVAETIAKEYAGGKTPEQTGVMIRATRERFSDLADMLVALSTAARAQLQTTREMLFKLPE